MCSLTPAGNLSLLEGEYSTTTIAKVTLQTYAKQATPHLNGSIIITTHRIAWVNSQRTRAISASLSQLPNPPLEDKSSLLHARLLIRCGRGVRVVFESNTPFKDRERFNTYVRTACTKQEWVLVAERKALEAERAARVGEYVPRGLGASAVAQRVSARNAATGQAISTSFASLEKLRTQAEELMTIAKNFGWKDGAKDNEMASMMAEMGIVSPVTKTSVGNIRVYREELAREIAEFLHGRVVNVGGLMTLSDAYCVVIRNRASVELVSPEDFRGACEEFTKLAIDIRLLKLESGVWSIAADAGREGALTLVKWIESRGCITEVDVARERHIPLQRARVMLEKAEMMGLLCRDSDVVTRFYRNRFDEFIQ